MKQRTRIQLLITGLASTGREKIKHRACIPLMSMVAACLMFLPNPLHAQQPGNRQARVTDIGRDRELFINDFLIDGFTGAAALRLHHPVPREIVFKCDDLWEGSGCNYFSIFKDGTLYRMYYRAVNVERFENGHQHETDADLKNRFCYAESRDGIHWSKPDLGIYEYKGSKHNNIVLASGSIGGIQLNLGDNASMFRDKNPAASPDARYKAIVCSEKPKGLFVFKSSDAIHWLPVSREPVITDGEFDSQNLAFWDSVHREYRAYWRIYKNHLRDIRTATSPDFIHWDHHADLKYSDTMQVQLYTNQVEPYYRAPYLLLGLPTRYIDRGWSESMRALPEPAYRELRSSVSAREGTAITEGMIMASLDGENFRRWTETFLRPGIEREGTWNYGQQYTAWGMIETKSDLEGAPNELSLYATENYQSQRPEGVRLRRYSLRVDGFVSAYAPMSGGSLITKPFLFRGNKLSLNFSSSAAGSIQVEIQDADGKPLPGFELDDCAPTFGDTLDRTITWKKGSDLHSLENKPIRLRFVLNDADLYSFLFQ